MQVSAFPGCVSVSYSGSCNRGSSFLFYACTVANALQLHHSAAVVFECTGVNSVFVFATLRGLYLPTWQPSLWLGCQVGRSVGWFSYTHFRQGRFKARHPSSPGDIHIHSPSTAAKTTLHKLLPCKPLHRSACWWCISGPHKFILEILHTCTCRLLLNELIWSSWSPPNYLQIQIT